ncbi:MAG: arylsulfatase [Spirochaetes bacterium]|uniref:Arylsulfatase n=1 Tax=Candidatus Ornithospirochaeta stercoripullorum TaxID=2840899 RepID=A0A9D9H422_9SPIO|nr:arylsulfatase [Candidatus Ornithospirochaeta stercoripullorum]
MDRKPNILFIMTDQLRGDSLGYKGHKDVKTPYIDTLASKGIDFSHAYSACPNCIAARAALLTGLSPEHNKRVGYQDNVPWDYERTLPGELAKAGYYTTCIGKMHVYPVRRYLGFHNVILHDGYMHASRYEDVPYRENQFYADDYFHWLKQNMGADADSTYTGLDCNSWVARSWCYEEKYHPTNWVTDNVLDFLRRRDPDMPFFLMASYLKPHPPLDPPEYYLSRYIDKELTQPAIGDWETKEFIEKDGRIFDSKTGPTDPDLVHEMRAAYYALITHLDHQIGRVIQALIEHKLYDNTLIVFSSDHGEELGDHYMFRKSRPYEGSCHIPMLFSNLEAIGIEGKQGTAIEAVTELRDIMPTLLDVAGARDDEHYDGKSLLDVIASPDNEPREYLHGEHSYGQFSNHWIVTKHDKYIWYSETGEEQYFNLSEDPHELRNLIKAEDKRERISHLRSSLIKELFSRSEGFTDGKRLISGREYGPLTK